MNLSVGNVVTFSTEGGVPQHRIATVMNIATLYIWVMPLDGIYRHWLPINPNQATILYDTEEHFYSENPEYLI